MPKNQDVAREHLRAHVDSTVCGKCRRPLSKGDRVTIAHIVADTGIDPGTFQKGTTMAGEYEVVHVDCRDPLLVKGLSNG